jgi:REP element-mobilizing transposase RayT
MVAETWQEIPEHFPHVFLGDSIVMPNHIHGIILIHQGRGTIYRAPTPSNQERFGKPTRESIPTIIRTFKAAVTRRSGKELHTCNVWQRNYYEHIIRDESDYERIVAYILDNPVNWDNNEDHAS